MKQLKKYIHTILLLISFTLMGVCAHAQTVYDWTGLGANSNWNNPANWSVGAANNAGGAANGSYPGSGGIGSTDIADFGVNISLKGHRAPTVQTGLTIYVASVNIGDNYWQAGTSGAPNPQPGVTATTGFEVTLTVNGVLNITNFLTQTSSTQGIFNSGEQVLDNTGAPYTYSIQNYVTGKGIINCTGFILGDNTVPTNDFVIGVTRLRLGYSGSTTIASALVVNINGDLTSYCSIRGDGTPTNNIISENFAELSFAGGTINLTGQIKLVESTGTYKAQWGQYSPIAWYSMDLFTTADSPTINFFNSTPLFETPGPSRNDFDFYNIVFTGGTGTSNVNFVGTGATQDIPIYKAASGVYSYIKNTPSVFNNVGFGGSGTKAVPVAAAGGTFSLGGQLSGGTLYGGNFTLQPGSEVVNISTNNPVLSIAANYLSGSGSTLIKSDGVALTIPGTTTNGGTFTHSGGAAITFTGAFANTATGIYNQSSTGTVTANSTASNAGTYTQSGSGFATFNGTFNSTATGIYNHTGTGAFTAASTTSNGGTFNQSSTTAATFTGAVTNTGTINQTSTGNISFASTFSNSGSASKFSQTGASTTTFTGAATNDGNITQNSTTGVLNFPNTFSNTLAGSTFTLTTGTTNFNNTYTNNGTFVQSGGIVNINQAGAQSLVDNGTSGTTFSNVNIENGSSGVTMSGTGQFYVSDLGVLTMSNSTPLAANGLLTVSSDNSGTGTIANIPSGCSITGNVTVQRYVPGGSSNSRGYRLLSSAVNAGTDVPGNKIYSINYLLNSTYISGTGFPTTYPVGGSKNGNPSLYLYRENLAPLYTTFLNSNYIGIAGYGNSPTYSMNDATYGTANIPIGNGYLFYFRGGTTTSSPFVSGSLAQPAVLASSGALNQGDITVADWYTPNTTILGRTTDSGDPTIEGFNLVGNPYPSSIDWDKADSVSTSAAIYTPHVTPFIYMLVPGGSAGSGNYGIYGRGTGSTINGATHIIPSGLGFFVIASSSGPATLKFTEAAKLTSQPSGGALFLAKRPPVARTSQILDLQMKLDSINSDEMIISFDANAESTYNMMEDARYKTGSGKVSLSSLSSDRIPLAINQLPLALKGDTIKLKVGAATSGNYTLNLKSITGIPQVYSVWLKDAFTKDSVNLRTTPSYSFTIKTGDSTTFGTKRFLVVITQDPNLAYKLLSFDAAKTGANNKQVQLTWNTQNEQTFTNFAVERSTNNGKTFEAIGGTIISSGAGAYNLVDKDPLKGDNQYRLKQVDFNNTITYSNVVEVEFNSNSNIAGHLNCYPNPAFTNINLNFDPKEQGKTTYSVKVTNSSGMIVRYAVITEPNWQANVSNLLTGTYLVQVTDKKDNSVVGQTKFVKL